MLRAAESSMQSDSGSGWASTTTRKTHGRAYLQAGQRRKAGCCAGCSADRVAHDSDGFGYVVHSHGSLDHTRVQAQAPPATVLSGSETKAEYSGCCKAKHGRTDPPQQQQAPRDKTNPQTTQRGHALVCHCAQAHGVGKVLVPSTQKTQDNRHRAHTLVCHRATTQTPTKRKQTTHL
jgi:hypothetical protein